MVFGLNIYTFPLEQRTVSLARCKQLRKWVIGIRISVNTSALVISTGVSGDGGDGGDGLNQD